MRNSTATDAIAQLRPLELESTRGGVPIHDQYDAHSQYQTLHDDLAELPQAYAAYLDHQQKQWS